VKWIYNKTSLSGEGDIRILLVIAFTHMISKEFYDEWWMQSSRQLVSTWICLYFC